MTTVVIDSSTDEGKWLLNLIKGHKSVTVIESDDKKRSFSEAAVACEAVSVDEFFDELDRRIKNRFHA